MKQKDKNVLAKYKIIQAALKEFSEYSYENSSINRICLNGNISKGVMYHYFKDKNELYLLCIKYCYDSMYDYFKLALKDYKNNNNVHDLVKTFLEVRQKFFLDNPLLKKIYFHTTLRKPMNLSEEINKITSPFKQLRRKYSNLVLNNIELRDDLTIDELIKLYELIQKNLNEKFCLRLENNDNIDSLMKDYEKEIIKYVDILFYGALKN